MISDKVYDRAIVLDFEEKFDKKIIEATEGKVAKSGPINLGNNDFRNKLDAAVKSFDESKHLEYEKIVTELDDFIIDKFSITFGNRIQEQLKRFVPVYVSCGGSIIEAIDVIFAYKVLRKLKGRFGEATSNGLNDLEELLIVEYPGMNLSLEVISRLKKEMM